MSLARFGVRNPVPVNLLMISILLAGTVSALTLRREFFPETEPEQAAVSLPYPGASPEEIEETLVRKVEDALIELDEVDEIRSSISEGGASIVVEFREGTDDIDEAIDEVERTVDALQDLPDDAERITVSEFEPKLPVIMVSLYGEADEADLKDAIRAIRDDLRTLPRMGDLEITGVRGYEVRVDVDQGALIEQGLSLPMVAEAVRDWMADVPGGTIRSDSGTVSVRTLGTEERSSAIGDIVVRATADGRTLRLRDIATIREGFVDQAITTRFNGLPSAGLIAYKFGEQDIIAIAKMIKAYVAGRRGEPMPGGFIDRLPGSPVGRAYELGRSAIHPLPPNTRLALHSDLARFVDGRLSLLISNALMGSLLVFGTLLVFLNWRGALWVGVGLVTALAGTLVLMQQFGTTLNLLTMFGLIIVIGLLVDDAIVVAENVQAKHDEGQPALTAAIDGAQQVFWPVVATVLTSIMAFMPLTFVKGQIGTLLGALPTVVAIALAMSLVESLMMLPSHLGHSLAKRDLKAAIHGRGRGGLQAFERWRDRLIFDRVVPAYVSVLGVALRHRYLSLAIAVATLILAVGMLAGGRVRYEFLSTSDAETIIADVTMPIGSPLAATESVVAAIEGAARAQDEVASISAYVGVTSNIETGSTDSSSSHVGQMFIELLPVEQRDRNSATIMTAIREAVRDDVRAAERVVFSEIGAGPGGPDITLRLRGSDEAEMLALADEIKSELARFSGVFDIADDNAIGQQELQVGLLPGAAALGFTVQDVARQLRGAVFGIDAHVFSDRQEDVDVRVRLDEDTRRRLGAVQGLWLTSPTGALVPLSEIAELTDGSGYSTIRRIDRRRAVTVTANTAESVSPEDIVRELPIGRWRAEHPAMDVSTAGRQEQQAEAFASLPLGFMAAMVLIYVILAWLFSSYTQPLAVMSGIPFAIIGVIGGHWLMNVELTVLSIVGFVALSGIVVNDSLILVKFYNERRDAGEPILDALLDAGRRRFRPIFLTTVTTVLGLTPLMLEQSFQARFLIPMAVSIAFGLMSATVLILLLLPCLLLIFDDIKGAGYLLWHGRPRQRREDPRESVLDLASEA